MSICAEARRCFEMDNESGDPDAACVYSELIQLVRTGHSLDSAVEESGFSKYYLYHMGRPGAGKSLWGNAPRLSEIG